MAYELREGQGTMFRVKEKKNDKMPDMKGEFLLGGMMYEIAGWTKESKKDTKFLSLKVSPKQDRQGNGYSGHTQTAPPPAPQYQQTAPPPPQPQYNPPAPPQGDPPAPAAARPQWHNPSEFEPQEDDLPF